MKKQVFILMFCLLCSALTVAAQTKKGFQGSWEWKSAMNKNKEQAVVWIEVKQKGAKATGEIWFNQLVDGEAEGTDGSFVPFIGTTHGDTLTIEFDSGDVRSIEEAESSVRYKKPGGRKPDTAVLKLKNGKLEWTQTQGSLDVGLGIPKRMTFRRTN